MISTHREARLSFLSDISVLKRAPIYSDTIRRTPSIENWKLKIENWHNSEKIDIINQSGPTSLWMVHEYEEKTCELYEMLRDSLLKQEEHTFFNALRYSLLQ